MTYTSIAGYLPPHEQAPVIRLWSGLSPVSKRLIACGAGLMLAMVMAAALAVIGLRANALDTAAAGSSRLALAIAEQTSRSIEAVDQVLDGLRKDIARNHVDTPGQFRTALHSETMQAALRQYAKTLPQADAFLIMDAGGNLVNYSRQWPVVPFDYSTRDYFRHFQASDDPNPFVSNPLQSRATGDWMVVVARRVNGPSGEFLGIVVGALNLGYMRDFYRALTLGQDINVALLKRDATVLATYPTNSRIGEILSVGEDWFEIVQRRTPETLMHEGLFASGPRVMAIHPLTRYPLVVDVTLSTSDALTDWRRMAALAALAVGSAVLCIVLLLRALILQLQQLEQSKAMLAAQNTQLALTGRRMEVQAGELQASREHLAQKSEALSVTLDHMNQGIMMVDGNHRLAVCNRRAIQLLDLPPGFVEHQATFEELIAYQASVETFADWDYKTWLGSSTPFETAMTYERLRADGRILEVSSVPLVTGGMVRTYTDVTERRNAEAKVLYCAHHDNLTKLANRVVFQERLEQAMALAARTRRSMAVHYLDLDRFKLVNDTMGHAAGDKLLVQVADRLQSAVRDIDTVARMGGDEFAIVQPLAGGADAPALLAERLLHLIKQPYDIDGVQCAVGVSIGIALYPDHASSTEELLRNADTSLYRAKNNGRGLYCVFEPHMDSQQQRLAMLEQDLGQALHRQQFEIEYQPVVDTVSRRVRCCEALLRWRHPSDGVIAPEAFIGLAERSRQIIPIGLWVLETACREAAAWPDGIKLAVNLSPAQFTDAALVGQVAAILRQTGLPAARLVLEITEGLLLAENSTVLGTMSQLHASGIRFALDDFGTGHAGLSALRRFPFQAIKIDKTFVKDMIGEPGARSIIAAMLGVGTALGLAVVAEGVESEEQCVELALMGCHQVQGFHTGRPLSHQQIRERIMPHRAETLVAMD